MIDIEMGIGVEAAWCTIECVNACELSKVARGWGGDGWEVLFPLDPESPEALVVQVVHHYRLPTKRSSQDYMYHSIGRERPIRPSNQSPELCYCSYAVHSDLGEADEKILWPCSMLPKAIDSSTQLLKSRHGYLVQKSPRVFVIMRNFTNCPLEFLLHDTKHLRALWLSERFLWQTTS